LGRIILQFSKKNRFHSLKSKLFTNETNMLLHSTQEYDNNFQQHGVPYFLRRKKYYNMKYTALIIVLIFFNIDLYSKASEIPVNEIKTDSLALSLHTDTTLLVNDRHIKMDGTVNFRDLGGIKTTNGKKIKWGKIFRSDKLSKLTQNDFETLAKLKIHADIDFRTHAEVKKEPDTIPSSIQYHNLSIGRDTMINNSILKNMATMSSDSLEKIMLNIYIEFPIVWSEKYKKFFELISNENNLPCVYHCTAGKDRTGIATALVLYVLGVDFETIKHEYELSNYYRFNEDRKAALFFSNKGVRFDMTQTMMKVKGRYLDAIFNAIILKYGSIDSYLNHQLGIDEEMKTKLRMQLLE